MNNNFNKISISDGRTLDLKSPIVMGILNITPDSFYDGGLFANNKNQIKQVEKMLIDGASIIDIGASSTRPGAQDISENEEIKRLLPALNGVRKKFPEAIISIDTYRSNVAHIALEKGADMINDISGGQFDEGMFDLIATRNTPYVIMHIQGRPGNMQKNPVYKDVVNDISDFFSGQLQKLANLEVNKNIILDPGFGFGKTLKHNYEILNRFREFKKLGFPLLAGISRKSMINKLIQTHPKNALNGTTVLNTLALMNGANILRVHDVKEAIQAIKLVEFYKNSK